ncbi:uncharacterized protein LOC143069851 [Mytilus galloprovincialis]|uniref:uncharacterized protein LOC143069851 n=1 Tax=Mytilus galloprovincialis TaxID=29158 RepID=UPI003F7C0D4A
MDIEVIFEENEDETEETNVPLRYNQNTRNTPTRYQENQYDHAFGGGGGGGGGLHRHEKRHHHSHHNSSRAVDGDGVDGYGNSTSNSTLNSRKSLRGSDKKRQRKCGLVILLLLGALLVAFGIGLLVYFLLLDSAGITTSAQTDPNSASVSVPVYNETYLSSMSNSSSADFKRIALPFCNEVNGYFQKSVLGERYKRCVVKEITANTQPINCKCSGLINLSSGKSINVKFDLGFVGDVSDEEILAIIREKAQKHIKDGFELSYIKDFLVNVKTKTETTTKIPDYGIIDATIANLDVKVFNLTWVQELTDNTTYDFLRHAEPFCADLDAIFKDSVLKDKYYSCRVIQFRNDPHNYVRVQLRFQGLSSPGMKELVLNIIKDRAKRIMVNQKELRMIGTLLIEPVSASLDIINGTIDLDPSPTPPVRPTPSLPPGKKN